MQLIVKFNIALLAVFLIGLASSYYFVNNLLQQNARAEIEENARIMMQSALAVREYTNTQIKPLLNTQLKYEFLPQSVPSYSATEYFNTLRKSFPEYFYKEATLNPTNPRDQAAGWEVDVVNHFRQNADAKELIGGREAATGQMLYLARPLRIVDPKCLVCHSTVDAAPQTLIDHYGADHGFGWQLKDVIGAQIVSVPYTLPLQRASAALRGFVYLLVTLFVFLFVAFNALLLVLVVRPVRRLAAIADQVSLGKMDVPEFTSTHRDEIATLGASFNRMRRSLVEALHMLEE